MLEVQDLRKVYGRNLIGRGGFKAIDGVSLSIGRGTVFGLLGPNGAGKTTLIKILLGLVRGYSGQAKVFGRLPNDPRSRQRIGYLPEAHRMPGYLTGRQVVTLFGQMSGGERRVIAKRAHELLVEVGLKSFADKKVDTYSKGMQQRVGLAQALVHEPELIFLDEPTDGVDPVGRMKIREIVQSLKDRGATIFINSHLLMEVEMICDRVVIMDKGRILREGTVQELTPDTGEVNFDLAESPPDLESLLGLSDCAFELTETGFHARLDQTGIDRVIDTLRTRGLSILAIKPGRLTLEETFVDMIKGRSA